MQNVKKLCANDTNLYDAEQPKKKTTKLLHVTAYSAAADTPNDRIKHKLWWRMQFSMCAMSKAHFDYYPLEKTEQIFSR